MLLITRRKRREFDGFLGFLTGSYEGAYASQISLLTKQTNFNTFVCLLLVCSFSPKVQKYLLGSPSPIKRREFDEIVVFSAGFENSSVLRRTRIFKFRRKSKISRIIAVLFNCIGFEASRASPCSRRQATCRRQAKARPRRS